MFGFHITYLMCRCPGRAQAWRVRFNSSHLDVPPAALLPADVCLATSLAPRASNQQTGTIPGEQDCDVVMQGMGISFNVDALLPFAKAFQGVVCMVGDLQILLPT